MIDEAGKEEMRKRFEEFYGMWNGISDLARVLDVEDIIIAYYLDVIAAELMRINKPQRAIIPIVPGRN